MRYPWWVFSALAVFAAIQLSGQDRPLTGKLVASQTGTGRPYGVEGALPFFLVKASGKPVAEKGLVVEYHRCAGTPNCMQVPAPPDGTVSFELPAGDYELVSFMRACDMNCGRLGSPVGECHATFSIKASETLHAQRVNRGRADPACTVTFSSTNPLAR